MRFGFQPGGGAVGQRVHMIPALQLARGTADNRHANHLPRLTCLRKGFDQRTDRTPPGKADNIARLKQAVDQLSAMLPDGAQLVLFL